MGSWNDILEIVQTNPAPDCLDKIRREYLARMSAKTGRNVILYYSGWLQKGNASATPILDDDKNGFMNVVYGLDRSKGLDLILHTPGGDILATDSIIFYLRQMFGTNIRAFVPLLAMSAGTMLACSCKEIFMGKHSALGPIDPQMNGYSCQGIVEEFKTALKEVDARTAPIWCQIISKYHPTFIQDCEKAMKMSNDMAIKWIETGMFEGLPNAHDLAKVIVNQLGDHSKTQAHARHFHYDDCEALGIRVVRLEADKELQDIVLSIHHACTHVFGMSSALKIIENNLGKAYIKNAAGPVPMPVPVSNP